MEREIQRFNEEASELQRTEFRRARTPGERARMNEHRPRRDYGKLFDPVIPFVEAFVSEDPAGRSKVPSQLSSDALGALRTFAHGAAVVAVRRESPPLIALSLAALAILAAVDDPRDLSFYLATVYYSATKLGLDTQKLFSEAASPAVRVFSATTCKASLCFRTGPRNSAASGCVRLPPRRDSISCRIHPGRNL